MSLSRDATQIDEENIGNTNTAPGPHQASTLHSTLHFVTSSHQPALLSDIWRGLSSDNAAPRDGSQAGH